MLARSETCCASVVLSRAPAGSLLVATGRWQSLRCPLLVTTQVSPFFAPTPLLGDTGADGALGLGVADDALGLGVGVADALAIPLNGSVPAAVKISTADSRRMPAARLRLNVGPPRKITSSPRRRPPRRADFRSESQGTPWGAPPSMTTLSKTLHVTY
jgi:hypothetical protein